MSAAGSYSSNSTDAYTNGLNPMYHSLTTNSQSEYDVIHTRESQTCLINPNLPPRVTTTNAIYASRPTTLKHPTLKHPTLTPTSNSVPFKSVPEMKHFDDEKSDGCCSSSDSSSCLFTSFIVLFSFLSILLSVGVIALCALHWTSIISITTSSSSSNSTVSNGTMSGAIQSLNTTSCNCTASNYTADLQVLKEIQEELSLINSTFTEAMSQLTPNESTLNSLSVRVQAISNSIDQLRIQATNTCSVLSDQQSITEPVELDDLGNQTCPINTTKLDRPATVTISPDDQCIYKEASVCTISPNLQCSTANVVGFILDDRILMDFVCYVQFRFEPNDGLPNGSAAIRQDTFFNTTANQSIYDDITTSTLHGVGCFCRSFEDAFLSCRYLARYCTYTDNNFNSTISL